MYNIQLKGCNLYNIVYNIIKKYEGGNQMFYVVDQWGQRINKFEDRDSAERYCEKWNNNFRLSKWAAPKARVIEGE